MTFLSLVSLLLILTVPLAISVPIHQEFMQCMSMSNTKSFRNIHTSKSLSYSSLLQASLQNLRVGNFTTLKPVLIVTPSHESEIQAAIMCSKKNGLQIRVKSGGHDYEGLSYLCKTPFVIIDLVNLRSIEVNIEDETAWVQTGATIGELYYAIAKKSLVHGFPAGICPTVGVGGHISGGGFGILMRKYGLAADNVLDAHIVDVNGRILDRQGMGEDLFWAIRGGGGASFGVIVTWKIKLVRVPAIVTGFTITKTLDQGAEKLLHRWQYIADKLHEDLLIRAIIQDVRESQKNVKVSFNSFYFGRINELIPLMNKSFPELGLQAQDCTEMSWIESTLYFANKQKGDPLEVLLDRTNPSTSYFKAKSDFVKVPIPEDGLQGIWDRFMEEERIYMIWDPYGERMNQILESETPFPHREGTLYNIQYMVKWDESGEMASNKHVNWIRMLYTYMMPYVSKNPRTAYVNYRDLDLGTNNPEGNTSFLEASAWGMKYFKDNFKRLAQVKSKADPGNFFRSEQSIPPLPEPSSRNCL